MKLQGNVTVQNHLKGSLSEEELLGFIRQTVAIPAGANVAFRLQEPDDLGAPVRLAFDAIWSDTQRGDEQELPAKVVTTVPPAPPKADAEQG